MAALTVWTVLGVAGLCAGISAALGGRERARGIAPAALATATPFASAAVFVAVGVWRG